MRYVLDTSTLRALLEGRREVVARLDIAGTLSVSVPQPVWAELAYGIERLPQSELKESLKVRHKLLHAELARAAWTDEVTEHFGAIKASLERRGLTVEDRDVTVAAHALAVGAVLVGSDAAQLSLVEGLELGGWESETSGFAY